MYATANKKMLNMLILDILRTYTDQDHSVTQQEILKLLDQNYGVAWRIFFEISISQSYSVPTGISA